MERGGGEAGSGSYFHLEALDILFRAGGKEAEKSEYMK